MTVIRRSSLAWSHTGLGALLLAAALAACEGKLGVAPDTEPPAKSVTDSAPGAVVGLELPTVVGWPATQASIVWARDSRTAFVVPASRSVYAQNLMAVDPAAASHRTVIRTANVSFSMQALDGGQLLYSDGNGALLRIVGSAAPETTVVRSGSLEFLASPDGRYVVHTETVNATTGAAESVLIDLVTGTRRAVTAPSVLYAGYWLAVGPSGDDMIGLPLRVSDAVFIHPMVTGATRAINLTAQGAWVSRAVGLGYHRDTLMVAVKDIDPQRRRARVREVLPLLGIERVLGESNWDEHSAGVIAWSPGGGRAVVFADGECFASGQNSCGVVKQRLVLLEQGRATRIGSIGVTASISDVTMSPDGRWMTYGVDTWQAAATFYVKRLP
jgi:hypothetical protein